MNTHAPPNRKPLWLIVIAVAAAYVGWSMWSKRARADEALFNTSENLARVGAPLAPRAVDVTGTLQTVRRHGQTADTVEAARCFKKGSTLKVTCDAGGATTLWTISQTPAAGQGGALSVSTGLDIGLGADADSALPRTGIASGLTASFEVVGGIPRDVWLSGDLLTEAAPTSGARQSAVGYRSGVCNSLTTAQFWSFRPCAEASDCAASGAECVDEGSQVGGVPVFNDCFYVSYVTHDASAGPHRCYVTKER